MARRSRSRRIRGPALQRRGGREPRPHHPRDEKRSAADYRSSAACGRADATRRASGCAGKVGSTTESSCPHEVNEGRAGKNRSGENKPGTEQRIKKFCEGRERAAVVARRFVAPASRRLF